MWSAPAGMKVFPRDAVPLPLVFRLRNWNFPRSLILEGENTKPRCQPEGGLVSRVRCHRALTTCQTTLQDTLDLTQMMGPVVDRTSPCPGLLSCEYLLLSLQPKSSRRDPEDGLWGRLDLFAPLPSVATMSKSPFSAFHSCVFNQPTENGWLCSGLLQLPASWLQPQQLHPKSCILFQ